MSQGLGGGGQETGLGLEGHDGGGLAVTILHILVPGFWKVAALGQEARRHPLDGPSISSQPGVDPGSVDEKGQSSLGSRQGLSMVKTPWASSFSGGLLRSGSMKKC